MNITVRFVAARAVATYYTDQPVENSRTNMQVGI